MIQKHKIMSEQDYGKLIFENFLTEYKDATVEYCSTDDSVKAVLTSGFSMTFREPGLSAAEYIMKAFAAELTSKDNSPDLKLLIEEITIYVSEFVTDIFEECNECGRYTAWLRTRANQDDENDFFDCPYCGCTQIID